MQRLVAATTKVYEIYIDIARSYLRYHGFLVIVLPSDDMSTVNNVNIAASLEALFVPLSKQESHAIAKVTARYAIAICGCPGQFRMSLAMPIATTPEIVNGLLMRWIVSKCAQN